MKSLSTSNSYYKDKSSIIKPDALAILIFLCGATASININIIGEVYIAELLLIPIGMIIIFFRGDNGVLRSGSFSWFMAFGLITISGYMITDIIIGTSSSQYLRGWGRVALLITNILCLILIVGQGRRYLWWFLIGMGIGGVLYLASTGLPFSIWKLGYGERISFIVLAISCILPRKLSLLLLVSFGLLNVVLDYRNFAAVYLLVAGIIWGRTGRYKHEMKGAKAYVMVGITLSIAIATLVISLSFTEDEFGGRRQDSNVGRYAGIIVSIHAISESPIIGYGSWTENEKFARMLRKEKSKHLDKSRARRAETHSGKLFRAHSQLLQPWIEGGLLGVSLFLYYAYRLVRGAKNYIFDQPIDRFSAMNLYFVILGSWHLIASPFGGDQRLLIAFTIAILAAIEFDSKRNVQVVSKSSPEQDRDTMNGSRSVNDRILQRRKSL